MRNEKKLLAGAAAAFAEKLIDAPLADVETHGVELDIHLVHVFVVFQELAHEGAVGKGEDLRVDHLHCGMNWYVCGEG